MKVTITKLTDWDLVKKLALKTVNKEPVTEVSDKFKRQILKAEHSPIRALLFMIEMESIPYYVSVHFSRHKNGVEHFVSTQRTDRTGVNRDEKRQDALVNHTMLINAQALINISRKRLCHKADKKTVEIWEQVVRELRLVDYVVSDYCVKECIYRKGCPEIKPCGFYKTFISQK